MSTRWSPMLVGDDPCLDALAHQLADAGVDAGRRSLGAAAGIGSESAHVVMAQPRMADTATSEEAAGLLTTFTNAVISAARRIVEHYGPGSSSLVVVSTRDGLGWAGRPWEAAAAGALAGVTRSLALEFARDGFRVNLVCAPASYEAPTPPALVGTPVTPDDVARAAMYFLDPENTYVTGQTLYVIGGSQLLSSVSA